MDSRLLMEIFIDRNGNLAAVDHSPYKTLGSEIYNHVVIDRVLSLDLDDSECDILETKTKEILFDKDLIFLKHPDSFELPSDGLYIFQRLIIPLKEHAGKTEYHYDNGLYNKSGEKVDFDEVWEHKSDVENIFWFDDEIFSIFNLIECFILTERDRLNEVFKKGCNSGCTSGSNSDNADLLATIIFVLKHYIKNKDFYEAQALLNKIETCNGLCKHIRKQLKECGCNGKSR